MASWSAKRRATYIGGILLFVFIVAGAIGFFLFYEKPTCSDGNKNGDEEGVDCGGSCQRICSFQAADPIVLWSRFFEVTPGIYSVVAFVENPNLDAEAYDVPYTFKVLDEKGVLIYERKGKAYIPAERAVPIFEGGIITDERVPLRSFFEFLAPPEWRRVEEEQVQIKITDVELSSDGAFPRLDAIVHNDSVFGIPDVEAVAILTDFEGNAIAASRTIVDFIEGGSSSEIVFTWPEKFAPRFIQCESPVDIMLLMDVSGSMNDDALDPPQPLTDSKNAALFFLDRLKELDKVGVVSFATGAKLVQPLTSEVSKADRAVSELAILPEEEEGYTNMGDAFAMAHDQLSFGALSGEKLRSVAILLTDGKANAPEDLGGEPYAENRATFAKDDGIDIYTIGLGDNVNAEFLKSLISEDGQYYKAASSKDLDLIYKQISDDICEGPSVVKVEIFPLVGRER